MNISGASALTSLSRYNVDQISCVVATILQENYVDTPPVDIYKLVDNYGITIHIRSFPVEHANVSGFITGLRKEKESSIIVINKNDTIERQKFTIAHEFGHLKLHKSELLADLSLSVLYKSPIGSKLIEPIEFEANEFAAQLLVPEDMLHADHVNTSTHPDKKALADKFEVSEDIIGFRLEKCDYGRKK
jgi:Zn-dependent peptidase ImmA (M78 family)